MTDAALRVRVAELCGWNNICERYIPIGDKQVYRLTGNMAHEHSFHCVPNYATDLNAMHEAVAELTEIQFCKYIQTLCGHTTPKEKILWCGEDAGRAERATACQRAEAFVKAMEDK